MTTLCPAKLNLFLSVGPHDASGYHPIRSRFQAISLCDRLTVEAADASSLTSNWDGLPEENTITRALALMQEIMDVPPLKIHLEKQIPAESGLGGGSSDAAGLLRILRRMAGEVPEYEFNSVAFAVGADVPFFLTGGRAGVEGYGEILHPLEDFAVPEWYVVARPGVSCSTPVMFRALDEKTYPWRELSEEIYNDFERVAPCECTDLIERLQVHGAKAAGLSGSGSAVFGIFADETHAQQAKERLSHETDAALWVAHSLTRAESLQIR